jgi:hypothetical protein
MSRAESGIQAQAAKVASFAAGSEGAVRKIAAGEFCQLN